MDASERDFLNVLGYLFFRNGKYEKAFVLFKALKRLLPDDGHVSKSLSYACLMLGKHEEAAVHLEDFLRNADGDREKSLGYLIKSKCLWGLGRKEEARDALTMFFQSKVTIHEVES